MTTNRNNQGIRSWCRATNQSEPEEGKEEIQNLIAVLISRLVEDTMAWLVHQPEGTTTVEVLVGEDTNQGGDAYQRNQPRETIKPRLMVGEDTNHGSSVPTSRNQILMYPKQKSPEHAGLFMS